MLSVTSKTSFKYETRSIHYGQGRAGLKQHTPDTPAGDKG
jgi:hypothetical protein